MRDVLMDRIPACRYVRLACERQARDLEDGPSRGLWFDPVSAQHSIDWFRFCHHSLGEWAGTPIALEPWQQFVQWCVFGWKREDGTRRFRKAYIEVARKNGKSTYLAGVGLFLLVADGEGGAHVYTAATDRDQARIIHGESTRMVKASPSLARRVGVVRDNLHVLATNSKYEPLPEKVDHGLNIHGALIDELHEHRTRDTWDVVTTSTGSRRQPLTFAITTAGHDRKSICYEQREYVRKILLGDIENDAFFGIIYALDSRYDWPDLVKLPPENEPRDPARQYEDDWRDERCWIKANPNLGVSKRRDYLREQVVEAIDKPAMQNAVLRLDFDIWTEASIRWINRPAWDACGQVAVNADALRGRRCYAGLDLSSTQDTTALVLDFPPEKKGEPHLVLPFFFIPQENMHERVRKDRVPYDAWWRDGYLTATPGTFVDVEFVLSELERLAALYDIRELAFDRWGATGILTRMQEMLGEKKVVQFGQGYASMSPALKQLEQDYLAGLIAHGSHPVLTWQADNLVVTEDPAGNMKPDKDKSTERIDGMVALVMAHGRATATQAPTGSVYAKRGLLML